MTTVQANVYRQVREHLLAGRWDSGEKLSELKLAEEFGVNRNPIREALLKLTSEGLLERQAGIGCRVPQWNIEAITDMYQLREVLEGQAARLAIPRISRAELEQLAEEAGVCANFLEQGNDAQAIPADNQFHRHLVQLSGNQALVHAWETNHVRALFRNDLREESTRGEAVPRRDPKIAIEAHRRIVEALRKGDPDEAEDAARQHVRTALADFAEIHARDPTWLVETQAA